MCNYDMPVELFAAEIWPNKRQYYAHYESHNEFGGIGDCATECCDANDKSIAIHKVREGAETLVKHYGADIGFWRVLHDIFVALAVFWHEAENTVCETATKEINTEDCAIVYG